LKSDIKKSKEVIENRILINKEYFEIRSTLIKIKVVNIFLNLN